MEPRRRGGVSTYLEVFILIAVALGGSAIAATAAWSYSRSAQGPSILLMGATISQGSGAAVERLTVYNSGNAGFGSFTLTTAGVPGSAQFCYSIFNPATKAVVSSTCPTLSTNPASVNIPVGLQPGSSLVVELELIGAPFTVGSSYPLTVSTPAGAQQAVVVEAVPA